MAEIIHKQIGGIDYTIKTTARTRKVLITIRPGGEVAVVKSTRISIAYVEKVMEEKFEWIQKKYTEQSKRQRKLLEHFTQAEYTKNKETARALVNQRLEHFNTFYQHPIGSISIRNQSSRWGSCSTKGNLSFNYKLVFLPPELADYVIVHELCHVREMNHSPRFWNLVAKQVPLHKEYKKQLLKY